MLEIVDGGLLALTLGQQMQVIFGFAVEVLDFKVGRILKNFHIVLLVDSENFSGLTFNAIRP